MARRGPARSPHAPSRRRLTVARDIHKYIHIYTSFRTICLIHTESAFPGARAPRDSSAVCGRSRSGGDRADGAPPVSSGPAAVGARGGGKEAAARASLPAPATVRPLARGSSRATAAGARAAARGFRARRVQRREGRRAGRQAGAVPRLTPTPARASLAVAAAGERWEATASPRRWIRSGKANERARLLPFLSFFSPVFYPPCCGRRCPRRRSGGSARRLSPEEMREARPGRS